VGAVPVFGGGFITEKQKRFFAGQTDLVSWLRSRGEELKRSGSEWEWDYHGERVTIRGNLWFNQYIQEGGNAVDFLRYFYNCSEESAVEALCGSSTVSLPAWTKPSQPYPKEEEKPLLEIPVASTNMRRVFAYLCQTRGISTEIISAFAHAHLLYETAEHHNAMFVGRDETGKIRHVHLRGTLTESGFRQTLPGSEKKYSFYWKGISSKLYVFEAPIDLLSYISLFPENWQENSFVALCGVGITPIERFLDTSPQFSEITLCLDNDGGGHKAAHRIAGQLLNEWDELTVSAHFPDLKDWNEQLLHEQNVENSIEEGAEQALNL